MSRRHAEISSQDGEWRIRDVGSLNGTYVNRERLSGEKKVSEWRQVTGGDEVRMGKTRMNLYFRVKVLEPELSKEEKAKKARKDERRKRRAERREERAAKRATFKSSSSNTWTGGRLAAQATSLLNEVMPYPSSDARTLRLLRVRLVLLLLILLLLLLL